MPLPRTFQHHHCSILPEHARVYSSGKSHTKSAGNIRLFTMELKVDQTIQSSLIRPGACRAAGTPRRGEDSFRESPRHSKGEARRGAHGRHLDSNRAERVGREPAWTGWLSNNASMPVSVALASFSTVFSQFGFRFSDHTTTVGLCKSKANHCESLIPRTPSFTIGASDQVAFLIQRVLRAGPAPPSFQLSTLYQNVTKDRRAFVCSLNLSSMLNELCYMLMIGQIRPKFWILVG